jgi:ATP-binding cassette subfamily B protein/subfamily B ATP-binding cassette protein MsbA
MALKYRISIIGSVFCSLMVALLWGANIGALYPFVEVVFAGESLHHYVENRIEKANQAIDENKKQIDGLIDQKQSADDPEVHLISGKIERFEKTIAGEEKKIATAKWIEPFIKNYMPKGAFETLLLLVMFFIVATLTRGMFLMGNMVLVARVGQRTMLDLQNAFFRKSLQMEMSEMDVQGTGDLVGRIRGETGAIGGTVSVLLGRTLREPMKMGVCIIGAGLINWRLLVFSMLICPLAAFGMLKLARSTKRANKKAVEESAKLLNRLFQAVTYLRIVKAFNMERHEEQRFQNTARDVYKKSMKIAFYNSMARVNNEMLGVAILCLSFLASGYLVLNNQTHLFGFIRLSAATMSFGELMLFFALLVGVTDPLRKMADIYNLIQGGIVAADRVFPLIDAEPKVVTPVDPKPFPTSAPAICFDNVEFSYRRGVKVLNQTNATIAAGTTVAIVGPNGCGKSTLVNMLPRFFDPEAGGILLNEFDTRDYSLQELRQNVGYVTQSAMLFNDSIAENIRYGMPDATDAQIIAAAKKAMAHEFIMELEHGYDSTIGEHGGKLSGGQRQRLTLARAILKDPKIMILDEATSQIDPKSEAVIHEALSEFAKNRTTILITHRVSSLTLADEIIVMDAGKVLDHGTHDELLGRCETYQRLRRSNLQEAA